MQTLQLYYYSKKEEVVGKRCHLNIGKFLIYKLLQTRRLSKELSLYDAYILHIIFPRHLLLETVEMHCCLSILHLFFIVTDLVSQIWILPPQ